MMADKPGENTDTKTGPETAPRRRRRFLAEPSDAPPPQAAESSETLENWGEKDRKGYFSGRPGPGRGHLSDGVGPQGDGAEGEGEALSHAELEALVDREIRRRGRAAWKDVPVSVLLQMRQVLLKVEPEPGAQQQVNVLLGDGPMRGIASAIMAPQVYDLDALDAAALRAEVQRLRTENESLKRSANATEAPKVKDLAPAPAPEPSKEAVECIDCASFVGIKGRMIEPFSKCKFCGQSYTDTVAVPMVWTRNRPPPLSPEEVERQAASGIAMCIGVTDKGWVQVADLSGGLVQGVREALDGQRRGPLD